jgi:hypothetical protein
MRNLMQTSYWSSKDLLAVRSGDQLLFFFFDQILREYVRLKNSASLGSVLAICAEAADAKALQRYPFAEIVLTGLRDPEPDLASIMQQDARIRYQKENGEKLSLPDHSFDLVLVKEGLHHLSRPVLGLYEMLRVCRQAVIIMEPFDCLLGRLFDRLGLSTRFEHSQDENINNRKNFIFRWNLHLLEKLLSSYYLDSGFTITARVGWKRGRYYLSRTRLLAVLTAALISKIPGASGNFILAMITPGRIEPPAIQSLYQ